MAVTRETHFQKALTERYCVRNLTVWGGQKPLCFPNTPQATFEVLSVGRAPLSRWGARWSQAISRELEQIGAHPNLSLEEILLFYIKIEEEGADTEVLPCMP